MKGCVRFICATLALLAPAAAAAAEPAPGDTCTTVGAFMRSGGPEVSGGGHFLVCDGANWISVLDYQDEGTILTQIGDDTGSCTAAKDGRIRYTSADPPWEYCDGGATSWLPFKQPRCTDNDTGECYLDATRSNDDPDFTAANIADGVNILGITGTLIDGASSWRLRSLVAGGDSLSGAGSQSCGIKADGGAWCWGAATYGKLGNGDDTNNQLTPVEVQGSAKWATIRTGQTHSCGLHDDGSAWCWGSGGSGKLGNGGTSDQLAPVEVSGGSKWVDLSIGTGSGNHTCGIKSDGSAWCWGTGGDGRLGDGSGSNQSTPVEVSGGATWIAVSAGGNHSCGIKIDGTAWCWGAGDNGRLGNGGTSDQLTPVAVSGGASWTAISVGYRHSCGIQDDGSAWCWGYGAFGCLGNGGTSEQLVPVAVSGGATWIAIGAGGSHSCGIQDDGSAWCWGYGSSGRLGYGGTSNQSTPTAVSGSAKWTAISAGPRHSCGTQSDGSAWCWGWGTYGQLGTGDTSNSDVPVQVAD